MTSPIDDQIRELAPRVLGMRFCAAVSTASSMFKALTAGLGALVLFAAYSYDLEYFIANSETYTYFQGMEDVSFTLCIPFVLAGLFYCGMFPYHSGGIAMSSLFQVPQLLGITPNQSFIAMAWVIAIIGSGYVIYGGMSAVALSMAVLSALDRKNSTPGWQAE